MGGKDDKQVENTQLRVMIIRWSAFSSSGPLQAKNLLSVCGVSGGCLEGFLVLLDDVQAYILKAKKFVEPLFQSKKIAEKVRKSGRHFWAIWG